MCPRIGDRVTGKLPFVDRTLEGTIVDFAPGDPEAGQRQWVLTQPTRGPWTVRMKSHGELMTLVATVHPHNARRIAECGF